MPHSRLKCHNATHRNVEVNKKKDMFITRLVHVCITKCKFIFVARSLIGAVWFGKIQPAPDSSANRSGSCCLFETLRNWIPWNPLRAQFRGDTARSGAISVNDTERQHEKESSVASAAPLDPRVRTKQNLSLP
jgi:hypothetical protein